MLRALTFFLMIFTGLSRICAPLGAIELEGAIPSAEKNEVFSVRFQTSYIERDPDDVLNSDIKVIFISPSGKETVIPAFCVNNDVSRQTSLWEVRFTPEEEGEYSFYAGMKNSAKNSEEISRTMVFNVKNTGLKGFLRKSHNNPNYLKFSSGEPFFGIGHNVAWVHNSSPDVFERYFSLMREAGCNMSRVWICDWSLPLEPDGIGNYSRHSSEKLDKIIDAASKNGIYLILCLDTYGSLMEESGMWGEGKWGMNPYNKKNGGPCKKPEDFFTLPEAIRAYKNKLRYISARWGYSPNILSFELWNEYNAPADWMKEMAEYLKSVGRGGELVTTSVGYPHGTDFDEGLTWRLDDVDIVTFHFYGNGADADIINPLMQKSHEVMNKYSKPFVASEFGIDFSRDDKCYDEKGEGTALHNSIWASVFSGSLGTAMNWWHDSYIRPKNLYRHYFALSKFLEGINWDSSEVSFPDVSLVTYKKIPSHSESTRDVVIRPIDKWGKADIVKFTVLNNGDLAGGGMPFKYLYGEEKKDLKVDQTYDVNFPEEGEFIVHVGTVSQGGYLDVFLDDVKIDGKKYITGSGKGPWKRSRFIDKYEVYQCVYDEDLSVKIPSGKHSIRLSNSGKDWIEIESITLKGYSPALVADARCYSIKVGGEFMFWVQNKASNWKTGYSGRSPLSIKGAYFEVYGVPAGDYTLDIWDTYKGQKISSKKIKPSEGKVGVKLPDLIKDVAVRLTPLDKK